MPSPRGPKWVAQIRRQGKRKQAVFRTKKEAQDWESTMRRLPAAEWERMIAMASIGERAEDYMDFVEVKFSHKTYLEKKGLFRRFWMADLPIDSLTPKMILDYLQTQASTRGGNAANKDRKNLVAWMNWCGKYHGVPIPNPALVDRFPEERSPRYIPPEEDFWQAYHAANGQDKTMLLAYLHLAARRGELFRLRWDDVDFGSRRVRLFTRKRKDGSWEIDWLPMTDALYEALKAHRTFSPAPELVFPDPQTGRQFTQRLHYMKILCNRAKVRHFGFHAIRHLSVSILAREGVPMIQIQGILRHRALATTERYLHRMEGLKDALGKLPAEGFSEGLQNPEMSGK